MSTWGDLHAGDVVQARTGGYWQVTAWEDVAGTRWVGAGGGRQRIFTMAPVDGSRPPISAPHVLSDPVSRVFQYDRSAEASAVTALAAVFSITPLEERLMDQPVPAPPPPDCRHPEHGVTKLQSGAIVCTECFTTLHTPAAPEAAAVDPVRVAGLGAGTLADLVPPYTAVNEVGTEFVIPAGERLAACAAGIHPIKSLTAGPTPGSMVCGACRAPFGVIPAVPASSADPGLDDGLHMAPGGLVRMGADEATAAAIGGVVAPAWIESATVDESAGADDERVTVVEPAAPAVVPDPFSDPAARVEVKRDRWGRYELPDPVTGEERAWTRASTLARCLADEYNLTGWKLRMVAIGIARNKDLAAGVLAVKDPDDTDDKKTLRELVKKAMERAESTRGANYGTALHNFTHRLDRGESLAQLGAPEPLDADLAEYQATLKRYGLDIVPGLIERIVVCPELGAAGTFDRIYAQHPGPFSQCPLTVGDLKTSKTVEWSWLEWAIQLAIYANATHLWEPATRTYIPMPPRDVLDRDRALIVHLPVGKATGTVYGLNLIEGYEAAHVAERVRALRNSGKGFGWSINPVNPEALLIQRVSHADGSELARLWDRHHPRGEWTDAVAHAAADRVVRLQSVPV